MLLTLLLSALIFAQETSYIEILKSDINTQRRALITAAMDFTEEEAQKFWPLYKEFEQGSDRLMDMSIKLIKEYAENYNNMTDEKADELIKRSYELEKSQIAYKLKYYEEFKQELGAKRSAKIMQVLNRIGLMLNLQKASRVPVLE